MMIDTQSNIDEFAHTAWRNDAVGPDKRTLKEACYLLLNCSLFSVLFSGLRPDERAEVVALAPVRTFNAGETVFATGWIWSKVCLARARWKAGLGRLGSR
jgi:hypothetical protein